jgi:hypothetical protein
MKKLILLALMAAAGWWYFIGGRTLTEAHVHEFYRNLEIATLQREPEALCSLLADDFTSTGTVSMGGRRQTQTQDKEQTCQAYRDLYASWEKLGEAMGGMLQLDSNYEVHSIVISADSENATVDFSSSLDVAGSIMNIRSRSNDTLIRRNGKVMLLRSEGKGSISSGS